MDARDGEYGWHLTPPRRHDPMAETIDVTRTNRLHLVTKRYQKFATIRASCLAFPFTVESKEGTLRGNAGDWLAIADDDSDEAPHRWIISAADFAKTYKEAE